MRLIDYASGIAVRRLSPGRLNQLRQWYLAARRRMYPILRWRYGTFGVTELRDHLEERIGDDFDILMVHSSLNNMQPMYTDSAIDLLKMLMAFCGPDRTLVMPTFYFGDPAVGGPREVFSTKPGFDIRRTPSQMGMLTELFRRSSGVVHSRHPVYRISAKGPHAASLVSGHESAGTPAGKGTPFDYMANHRTMILGIGKNIEVLTQVRHAEYLMGNDFPVPAEPPEQPVPVLLVDGGEEIPFQLAGRSFKGRFDILRLRQIMDKKQLREWRFHNVPMFAVQAASVTNSLVEAAQRGVTLYR